MRKVLAIVFSVCFIAKTLPCDSQVRLSLDEVVDIYSLDSPAAKQERIKYSSAILSFENYKKGLLPAVSLNFNSLNFNHSMKLVQQASDGEYLNVDDYTFSTGLGFTVNQYVGFTGGNLSVSSSLNFLNEMGNGKRSFSTTPVALSYSQPFWGGRKEHIHNKLQEYRKKDLALLELGSALAEVQGKAVGLFLSALVSEEECMFAQRELFVADSLYVIAQKRFQTGDVTGFEVRQVLLRLQNDRFAFEEAKTARNKALRSLFSYLGIPRPDSVVFEMPSKELPSRLLMESVRSKAASGGAFIISQDIEREEAEFALYSSQKSSRLGGNISLSYGTNQYATTFSNSYTNPNARQYASISFSIPTFQWGIIRNKKRIARNTYESKIIDLDKKDREFEDSVRELVEEYNSKAESFQVARQTYLLSQEQESRYLDRYKSGKTKMSDYYSLIQEQASARKNYLNALTSLWNAYFSIRGITLFDFVGNETILDSLIP